MQKNDMKLKKSTISELGEILEEEFGFCLEGKELEKFACSLMGYFDLLAKINKRRLEFGSCPRRRIDTGVQELENIHTGNKDEN